MWYLYLTDTAGEWISGSVCMYLSYRLANPHPSDTAVSLIADNAESIMSYFTAHFQLLKLLRELEFVIVPVANPDGYYVSSTYTSFTQFTGDTNRSGCALRNVRVCCRVL